MSDTRRAPRWPVASVIPNARVRIVPAPISASRGERPCASRAALGLRGAALEGALTGGFACTREPPRTAAGIRVLRDPKHQSVEIHALQRRLLWDERGGRHAGLGIDLKEDQNILNIVVTKVRPGDPSAPQGGMRRLAHSKSFF